MLNPGRFHLRILDWLHLQRCALLRFQGDLHFGETLPSPPWTFTASASCDVPDRRGKGSLQRCLADPQWTRSSTSLKGLAFLRAWSRLLEETGERVCVGFLSTRDHSAPFLGHKEVEEIAIPAGTLEEDAVL